MSKSIAPKKKRGGPRNGAGRKPVENKKQKEAVTIYVEKEDIKRHGGKISLKEKLLDVAMGPMYVLTPLPPADIAAEASLKPKEPPKIDNQTSAPSNENEAILKQIEAVRAEKCPKERDTVFGRKSFEMDKQKRIKELENQLK